MTSRLVEDGAAEMQRKGANTVVRSGCLSCLKAQIPCKGTSPHCRRVGSAEWRCNSDVAWKWHGSWRERRGIHIFAQFTTSPEHTGLFESEFWHRTVLQACFHSPVIYHVGSAIGALHEHIIKRSRGVEDKQGLAFALEQCNKSIAMLRNPRSSISDIGGSEPDAGETGILCVLLAYFEAMQGHIGQAVEHTLQCRKMVRSSLLKGSAMGARVGPLRISPAIRRLEMQSKAVQGRKMERLDTSVDPPFPECTPLHSLEHAHEVLLDVYTRLVCFVQDIDFAWDSYTMSHCMSDKYANFIPWLKQWEVSFADFLFHQSSKLSPNDLQRAKILKANHILSTILASTDQGTTTDWDEIAPAFESDFRAIIDLSASILNTFTIVPFATMSKTQFPYLSHGLWVTEPLYFAMARSRIPELQRQAAGLLSGMPSATSTVPTTKNPTAINKSIEIVVSSDIPEETMSLDDWISFAKRTRADAGMATYFGKLSTDDIVERTSLYLEDLSTGKFPGAGMLAHPATLSDASRTNSSDSYDTGCSDFIATDHPPLFDC